jgi:hypothetical protein
MSIVHKTVRNRVAGGGVRKSGVSVFHRGLGGDHDRSTAAAIVDDLQQVWSLRRRERIAKPVVEDQQRYPGRTRRDRSRASIIGCGRPSVLCSAPMSTTL